MKDPSSRRGVWTYDDVEGWRDEDGALLTGDDGSLRTSFILLSSQKGGWGGGGVVVCVCVPSPPPPGRRLSSESFPRGLLRCETSIGAVRPSFWWSDSGGPLPFSDDFVSRTHLPSLFRRN